MNDSATNKKIFLSYSHEDEKWLKQLKEMMEPANLNIWDDEKINPGENWSNEVEDNLKDADIAILLISKSYLASKYIKEKELPFLIKASNKGNLILSWILLADCLYDSITEIKSIQALHNPKYPLDSLSEPDRNKKLSKICKRIINMVSNVNNTKSLQSFYINVPSGKLIMDNLSFPFKKFKFSKKAVSNKEYSKYIHEIGKEKDIVFNINNSDDTIYGISYEEAQAFCKYNQFRLPTIWELFVIMILCNPENYYDILNFAISDSHSILTKFKNDIQFDWGYYHWTSTHAFTQNYVNENNFIYAARGVSRNDIYELLNHSPKLNLKHCYQQTATTRLNSTFRYVLL